MISVAPIDNTSLVCDPSWMSNALEQAERLTSDTRAKKVLQNFAWNLLYNKVLHTFACNPLYVSLQAPDTFILPHGQKKESDLQHKSIFCLFQMAPERQIFDQIWAAKSFPNWYDNRHNSKK